MKALKEGEGVNLFVYRLAANGWYLHELKDQFPPKSRVEAEPISFATDVLPGSNGPWTVALARSAV